MEVIGTVAATAQLLGMVMKILESISQLHDLVKHAPGRYRGWDAELTILGEMIYCIQVNPALQTFQVGRVIANISPKIESLVLLCREHCPRPEVKPLKRVLTALSACAIEPRILRRFESLEQDKSTLLLAINLHIASNPLAIEDMPSRAYEELREGSTENTSDTHDITGSLHKALILVKKDDNTDTPKRRSVHTSDDQDKRHSMSSTRQYDAGESVAPQQGMGRRSSYTAITVLGHKNVLGTSKGDGADFKDVHVEGRCHVVGDHEHGVISNALKASTGPKRARGRRSRRNVSSLRSSTTQTSEKGSSSEVALRGRAANMDDYGKPKYES
ncbi:hypothetical protein F4680DRAFT_401412 [Xylaria scruposa]|nr:hypothetical protein F4680DRAFT_401412 [Xylaria scruposa]